MIDLTPLDVRNKRGDFRKGLRGYEPAEVDTFLEIVAERLEMLVRENLQLKERTQSIERQLQSQTEREEAVRDALVTAQELRAEIRDQARREADKLIEDARTEARRMVAEAEAEVRIRARDAERRANEIARSLAEMERGRLRFLRSFRQLLEREMDMVEVEEARTPLEDSLSASPARGPRDEEADFDPVRTDDPDAEESGAGEVPGPHLAAAPLFDLDEPDDADRSDSVRP